MKISLSWWSCFIQRWHVLRKQRSAMFGLDRFGLSEDLITMLLSFSFESVVTSCNPTEILVILSISGITNLYRKMKRERERERWSGRRRRMCEIYKRGKINYTVWWMVAFHVSLKTWELTLSTWTFLLSEITTFTIRRLFIK